jgi:hypothetical protein
VSVCVGVPCVSLASSAVCVAMCASGNQQVSSFQWGLCMTLFGMCLWMVVCPGEGCDQYLEWVCRSVHMACDSYLPGGPVNLPRKLFLLPG